MLIINLFYSFLLAAFGILENRLCKSFKIISSSSVEHKFHFFCYSKQSHSWLFSFLCLKFFLKKEKRFTSC